MSLLGQTLGHFHIIEQIGAGGMGVVYRARDQQLDRDVAVKVLPAAALADEDSRKRFRKEALAVARLNHPNIGIVHAFDVQDGVDFLVMEYIPGSPLSQRLASGPIPEKEALVLAAQVASALEEAHREGIIHRDLKPGNILVTPRGQAKVLDFGLARILERPDDNTATETLASTRTDAAAGTLPYMAPEQLRGQPADARTDLFAFGSTLYEIVTGLRPFHGTFASQIIETILYQPPRSPRHVNSRISAELDRIILKCLEKDPENRYQSAKELSVDLRRLAAPSSSSAPLNARREPAVSRSVSRPILYVAVFLLGLVGVLAADLAGVRSRVFGRVPAPRIQSLAVLPLANLSHDAEQDYFADGMTEALIANLAQVSALRVVSRTSVMHYKGSDKTLPQIARDLNVDAVVEGSVQRSGSHVQVTAKLVAGQTDTPTWARVYDRDSRDVLFMQSELARAIVAEIQVHLTPQERQNLSSARPVNPEAYNAYLLGRYHMDKRDPASMDKGIEYFQRAIQLDPNYAQAYAGLAGAYGERDIWAALGVGKSADLIRAATLKALELDSNLADAHLFLAQIHFQYDWDWPGAEAEFKRAIDLNPNLADAYARYAFFLQTMSRHSDAIAAAHRAVELDPLSAPNIAGEGRILYRARKYTDAIARYQRALELNPLYIPALSRIAEAHLQLGEFDQALADVRKLQQVTGNPQEGLRQLAEIYARTGKRRQAEDVLRQIQKSSVAGGDAFAAAVIFSALGDRDRAFAELEKGLVTHSMLPLVFVDPFLDPLRSDPRFQQLLRRAGLPQ